VTDGTVGSADPSRPSGDGRLDSWKEIAAYLRRDVTTVRRWEKREGLPVYRHLHERRDSVYAYAGEIDRWWETRRNGLAEELRNGRALTAAPGTAARVPAPVWWVVAAVITLVTLTPLRNLIDADGKVADGPAIRFPVSAPDHMYFGSVSLSPDGRMLAFTATPAVPSKAQPLLWIRSFDTLAARVLPETEGATFPFWSPNNDALGFFAGGKLWVLELPDGSPRSVADAPDGRGASWNRDGIIVFAPDRMGPLLRVAAAGGRSVPVTVVTGPAERGHLWPDFLPDGNHFLYLAHGGENRKEHHNLFVGALDGTPARRLFAAASNVTYSATGHLVFVRERQLMMQPFDPTRLAITGEAVIFGDRIHEANDADHRADFSVSANGILAYRTMQSPASRLLWHGRSSPLTALVDAPAEYFDPTFSPDESRVAIARFDPRPSPRFGFGVVGVRSDIWTIDRATGVASQVTFDPGIDWGPVWAPDGRSMVFSSNRHGPVQLFQKNLSGSDGEERPLTATGSNPVADSWSPDGSLLVYTAHDQNTRADLWLLPMRGEPAPRPLVRTAFGEEHGRISPDGRWIVYTSDLSGQREVYVQSFPHAASAVRVSVHGGSDARWRPDGRELYYVTEERQLMAVAVKLSASFEHAAPVPLFAMTAPPRWYYARNLYDVSRDDRFLLMTPIEDDRTVPLTVVVNWPALRKP
jgi:Tol biopolymer transport system component